MRSVWPALVLMASCAPPLELHDLQGELVDPFARHGVEVFVFVRSDCPISNRYAPELARLHEAFEERNARLWLVYPDPKETAESMRAHQKEYDLDVPSLHDPQHQLVARAKATVTPEAAVFDAQGRLVYHGRIDDRFPKFGASRPAATSELRSAVDAALAGESFEPSVTEAVGCYIADLNLD